MSGKIGIFSGTFDPIHAGHVEFALEACKAAGLQHVFFMIERSPRGGKTPVDYEHRKAMLQLAIKPFSTLSLHEQASEQFTVSDTLPRLQKQFAGSQLVYLAGSDIVATFSYRWPGLDDFLRHMPLVIGIRKNDSPEAVSLQLEEAYAAYNLSPKYVLLPSPRLHLASTSVRAGTHKVDDITPEVAAYITSQQLY